jgi:hypothetical protein
MGWLASLFKSPLCTHRVRLKVRGTPQLYKENHMASRSVMKLARVKMNGEQQFVSISVHYDEGQGAGCVSFEGADETKDQYIPTPSGTVDEVLDRLERSVKMFFAGMPNGVYLDLDADADGWREGSEETFDGEDE